MWRNSFVPWALLGGPRTPVIRSCAFGKRSPSIPMNGIDPPSPHVAAGLLKNAFDARSTESASHFAVFGASHPPAPFSESNWTRAPYGESDSSNFLSLRSRLRASREGGRRIESFSEVNGRNTLPPCTRSGIPACPVIDSVGRHHRLSSSSVVSLLIGRIPSPNGNGS